MGKFKIAKNLKNWKEYIKKKNFLNYNYYIYKKIYDSHFNLISRAKRNRVDKNEIQCMTYLIIILASTLLYFHFHEKLKCIQ